MNNLDYQYHISGAVKSAVAYVLDGSVNGASSNTANLTTASSVPKVLYSETLYYEDCDSEGCTPQYNGNISRMVHHLAHINQFFSTERDVAYYYDELNRLTKVDDKDERNFYDEAFTYDAQGRIVRQARAEIAHEANGGASYVYIPNTNKLLTVSSNGGGKLNDRFIGNSYEIFRYDRDGNMVEDKSKQMTISYDHRGLPVEFKREVFSNENGADSVRLVLNYDGAGSRITKIRERKSAGETEWTAELTTHYTGIGSEIREDAVNNDTKVVVNLPQGLGRYDIASANDNAANTVPSFEWYLKNHLGSTMLVYGTQGISDPTVANLGSLKAAYDYRAFGEQVDLTHTTDKVTETFTGKEKDDETELSNHGARMLDPMLGIWIAVDPERFFSSPYLYMGNGYNPIRFVDLKGEKPGDKFDTPDEAAKDWARYVNNDSKIMNREAATYILKTDEGKYQTPPITLWANEAGFNDWQIDVIIKRCGLDDLEKVGVAHTHGDEDPRYNSEKFSTKSEDGRNGDIEDARLRGIPLYLGTPFDKFMKFDPANNKTTSEPLYDDLPEDP